MAKEKNIANEPATEPVEPAAEPMEPASGEALCAEAVRLAEKHPKSLADFKKASEAMMDAAIVYAGGRADFKLYKATEFFDAVGREVSCQHRGLETAIVGLARVRETPSTASMSECYEHTKGMHAGYSKMARLAAEAQAPEDLARLGAAIWEFAAAYLDSHEAWRREFNMHRMDRLRPKDCMGCVKFRGGEASCTGGADVLGCAKNLLLGAANRVRRGLEDAAEKAIEEAASAREKAIEEAEAARESELRADVDFCRLADFLDLASDYMGASEKGRRAMLLEWWTENGPCPVVCAPGGACADGKRKS